jgi:hypothetical protein
MPLNEEPLLSPVAMLSMGHRFYTAGATLQAGQHAVAVELPVSHYLYGHALELTLKAFLVARGKRKGELKQIGHDLVACLDAARSAGLDQLAIVSGPERAAIELLNEAYESKDLEYAGETIPAGRLSQLPSTAVLDRLVARIAAAIRQTCLDALNDMRSR